MSRVSKKMDECKDSANQAVFNLEAARLNLLVYSRWVGHCLLLLMLISCVTQVLVVVLSVTHVGASLHALLQSPTHPMFSGVYG